MFSFFRDLVNRELVRRDVQRRFEITEVTKLEFLIERLDIFGKKFRFIAKKRFGRFENTLGFLKETKFADWMQVNGSELYFVRVSNHFKRFIPWSKMRTEESKSEDNYASFFYKFGKSWVNELHAAERGLRDRRVEPLIF